MKQKFNKKKLNNMKKQNKVIKLVNRKNLKIKYNRM